VLFASDTTPAVPRPEVLRALESLSARGLVTRLGRGRYEFVEPMLGEYVRRVAGNESANPATAAGAKRTRQADESGERRSIIVPKR
jgi:hypothetical protein